MNEEWVFVGEFASLVFNYVRMEWDIELAHLSREKREWALKLISDLKNKASVPSIAAKIATEL